jgi:hypothetical protein
MKGKSAKKDYRQELEKALGPARLQEIQQIDAEIRDAWALLNNDPQFIISTARVIQFLESVYNVEPQLVKDFFRHFGIPTLKRLVTISEFLKPFPDEIRAVFMEYAKYVDRFRVHLKFRDKKPHFKPNALLSRGFAFTAKIKRRVGPPAVCAPVERNSKTTVPQPRDQGISEIDFLESKPGSIPEALRPMLRSKAIKFVDIDDDDGSSIRPY